MKNFKFFMILATIAFTLTFAFGWVMARAIKHSIAYGLQPEYTEAVVAGCCIVAIGVVLTAILVRKAAGWLMAYLKFKIIFGLEPPYDPQNTSQQSLADRRQVDYILSFLDFDEGRGPFVEAAEIAEKFGYLVKWPERAQESVRR